MVCAQLDMRCKHGDDVDARSEAKGCALVRDDGEALILRAAAGHALLILATAPMHPHGELRRGTTAAAVLVDCEAAEATSLGMKHIARVLAHRLQPRPAEKGAALALEYRLLALEAWLPAMEKYIGSCLVLGVWPAALTKLLSSNDGHQPTKGVTKKRWLQHIVGIFCGEGQNERAVPGSHGQVQGSWPTTLNPWHICCQHEPGRSLIGEPLHYCWPTTDLWFQILKRVQWSLLLQG